VELFPDHAQKRNRELFPHKTAHSNHRRTDALDNHDAADLMHSHNSSTAPRSLADRITGAAPRPPQAKNVDTGFSFKGAADGAGDGGAAGFSIRGASREINEKVKELFPDKVPGNTGKELFPGGTRARGGQRRRAEELL